MHTRTHVSAHMHIVCMRFRIEQQRLMHVCDANMHVQKQEGGLGGACVRHNYKCGEYGQFELVYA